MSLLSANSESRRPKPLPPFPEAKVVVVVNSTLVEGTTVVVGPVEIIGTVVVARLDVSVPKALEVETGKNVVSEPEPGPAVEGVVVVSSTLIEGTTGVVGPVEIIGTVVVVIFPGRL